jgi:hypothetical protein
MPEVIREEQRKARKPHTCSYCGEVIQPGETYDYAVLRDGGDMYDWKSHKTCSFIASTLWNYIDPDEGMTEEDFQQGCTDFCRAFICPNCPDADREAEDCKLDRTYCVDKIYEFLQTHDFRRVTDNHGWTYTFKCFPKRAAQAGEGEQNG